MNLLILGFESLHEFFSFVHLNQRLHGIVINFRSLAVCVLNLFIDSFDVTRLGFIEHFHHAVLLTLEHSPRIPETGFSSPCNSEFTFSLPCLLSLGNLNGIHSLE